MIQFTHMLLTAAAGYQKPLPGQIVYTSSRHGYISVASTSYSFVVPPRVRNITALCVGPGGTFFPMYGAGTEYATQAGTAGQGGALVYGNNIAVTPGETLTIEFVDGNSNTGSGNYSRLKRGSTILLYAYQYDNRGGTEADGGGNGGNSSAYNSYYYFQTNASGQNQGTAGAGGAAGYTGNGGNGGYWVGPSGIDQAAANATGGSGGGGGGGGGKVWVNMGGDLVMSGGGGGGGVGLLGQGTNGGGGGLRSGGGGGSGGEGGGTGGVEAVYNYDCCGNNTGLAYYYATSGSGGNYGGGKGTGDTGGAWAVGSQDGFWGAGAIRIIWPGDTRSYPNTNTGNL